MKASTRFLVLLVIIEALIIGGAFFSIWQIRSGAWNAGTQPDEVIKRIGSVAGMIAPIFAAFMVAMILVTRKVEKKAALQKPGL